MTIERPLIDQASIPAHAARDLPGERSAREAAQDFEALFVGHILKVLRESVESAGLGEEGPGKNIQMEMMDQELARALVRKGGFGLARQIQNYLEQTARRQSESHQLDGPACDNTTKVTNESTDKQSDDEKPMS